MTESDFRHNTEIFYAFLLQDMCPIFVQRKWARPASRKQTEHSALKCMEAVLMSFVNFDSVKSQ